ncbi:MAG: hypothetical protein ACXVC6_09485 [Bacteroidia bacterium]
MAYTELKEKLEKLLTEDLSNRSTLQDARRNLFLNSEGAKVQQQILAEKQGEISSLNLLVEKKKTILQLKDEQINAITKQLSELEEKIASSESNFTSEKNTLLEKIAALENQVSAGAVSETKLSELSLQNEEFSAKIRELIYHIDAQNSEFEKLKQQVADKSQLEASAQLLEEKIEENKNLQEKADLLFASEQQLKMLVASQNNDIEALTKVTHGFKKQTEDIAAGWQIQQDQLIMDNANLLAELSLLKESIASAQAANVSAEEMNAMKTINADLTAELELTKEDSANKISAISSELEALRSEREDSVAKLSAISSELETLRLENEESLTKFLSISSELETLRSEKEFLSNTNEGLVLEITSLKDSASSQNTALTDSLTQELNSLKAEKEALSLSNTELLSELATLKETTVTQNTEVSETLMQELNTLKAEKETLATANAGLSAEITSLKESATQAVSAPVVESLTEEQIAEVKAEKEHLATELEAIKHELNIVTQNREEKIISLQNEIGTLQNQLVSLSNSLNIETEEKNQLGTQIDQLTNLVTEKEQQLAGISNSADEEFVDKLMQQINFLSDQKNSFETLYHDSVAELNLTKANLASITQLVDGQKDSISDLEETNKHVKLAQTLVLQAKDKTEAKQAINELVREIDRCIALLSE